MDENHPFGLIFSPAVKEEIIILTRNFLVFQKVLTSQLGPDWRSKLDVFEDKPFAAASIGQVHYGVLKDGTEVAIKIQYPGVAEGIESDINNLVSVMKIWNIFPEGIYL